MDDDNKTGVDFPLTTPHTNPYSPSPHGGSGGGGDGPNSVPEGSTVQFYPAMNPDTAERVQWLPKEEKKEEEEKEEEEEDWKRDRMFWSNKWEYILSTVGYCVGLGNLFRFPYLCNRNGGGAFLIPFLLSLTLLGLPLFALEVIMGQFTGRNSQQVWSICPLFKGAGVGMVMVSFICFYYYNTLMAWGFYYLAMSFQSVVPWSVCHGWWNTPHCFTYSGLPPASQSSQNTSFVTALNATNHTVTDEVGNITGRGNNVTETRMVSAAEEFFQHNVLQLSGGLEEPGSVVWYLALTLALALFLCFLSLFKGIHSSGKVAYVTATAPYLLVTALLIRGATLPGAVDGIIFYLKPDFSKLIDPQVWVEAALQVFYSLGPGWGGLVVMASFNKFHNNCLRDAVILTLVSEGTSIYGGLAIFSVLGYMAHESGQDIDSVVSSGPGLAFIAYPEAISLMPLPQLWAVLFFFMIITLAIDSQMTHAEVVLTTFTDLCPSVLRHRRVLVTGVFCSVLYVISLPYVTQGGMYVFQLVDWFMAALTLIAIGIIECIVVGWIYGVSRIGDDMYLMLGRRPPFILCVFWKYITPCLLSLLMLATFVNYTPPTYGDYVYDVGGSVFGWTVASVSFVPIPAFAVYQLWKGQGSLLQRLRQSVKPDYSIWKPADSQAALMYGKERQQHV